VLIHSWYLRRLFWSDDFEDIMAIIDKEEKEEKYEQPTITQIVHALVIYGLVVIVGFFLLIGLSNHQEQNTTIERVK